MPDKLFPLVEAGSPAAKEFLKQVEEKVRQAMIIPVVTDYTPIPSSRTIDLWILHSRHRQRLRARGKYEG